MKYVTILFIILPFLSFSQTFHLKTDSVNTIKLKVGKSYTYRIGADIKTEKFDGFKEDSMIFAGKGYHFKSIDALRNPKRKPALDALAYPLSIGSCVAVSTVPISYIKGYFLADTDRMFNTLGLFIGETIVFSITRSYIAKNNKWLVIKDLEALDYN